MNDFAFVNEVLAIGKLKKVSHAADPVVRFPNCLIVAPAHDAYLENGHLHRTYCW